eukprot:15123543-Ditylum_brightwellii.AAC.1
MAMTSRQGGHPTWTKHYPMKVHSHRANTGDKLLRKYKHGRRGQKQTNGRCIHSRPEMPPQR